MQALQQQLGRTGAGRSLSDQLEQCVGLAVEEELLRGAGCGSSLR